MNRNAIAINPREASAILQGDASLISNGGALDFLRDVAPETAKNLEYMAFQVSAMQMAQEPVSHMAEKGAMALYQAVCDGRHGGRFRFHLNLNGNHWTFLGFSGSSHNLNIEGGMEIQIDD
jgi:hypothetical protein